MVTLAVQTPILRFVPVDEAARTTGLPVDELLKRIEAGKILVGIFDNEMRVAMTDNGGLVKIISQDTPPQQHNEQQDDDINARLSRIRREDFAHLEGVPITVSEAARKYEVPSNTLYKWVLRGYIAVLGEERGDEGRPGKVLNEAEVAYCAAIYKVRKPFGTRAPLLDTEGKPYLLKNPRLAALRRRAKREE